MVKVSSSPWVVKIHADTAGKVWWADGDGVPRPFGGDAGEFLERQPLRPDSVVRLSGAATNCELILGLVMKRVAGLIEDVQVCSPLAVSSRKRRGQPEAAFSDMRNWKMRGSCGGWRSVGPEDVVAYELVREMSGGRSWSPRLKEHQARFAIESARLRYGPACQLLAELVDPRFYIDPKEPDRCGKLERFLGLEPEYAASEGDSVYRKRYELVTSCWKGHRPTSAEASVRPHLFLWDTYYREGSNWTSELKAGKRLIRYLRHVWLDEIYRGRTAEPLFVPEYFFGVDESRVAWFKVERAEFSARLAAR